MEPPVIEDAVRIDSLIFQVTFDLGDGTHLSVAGPREENFNGLHLYRYRALPDSSWELLAVSPPAFDSWTMYPTLFQEGPDSWLILANFGSRESWGQKVLRLRADGFHDLGFLNVALPERTEDGELKLKSVAPVALIVPQENGLNVSFNVDSLLLYDDLRGNLDKVVPASSITYRIIESGAVLVVNGEEVRALPVL